MATESTGRGEPDRTLRLLWRDRLGDPVGARGPKQRSSVDEVVDAAVRIADEDGIDALSMRRIAERLGLKPMSVYTYVPGKAELIDLMVDRVAGETPAPPLADSLRERLAQVAHVTWHEYARHPWLLSIDTSRPPLGPNVSDRWEWSLSALEGLGLDDFAMDHTITLIVDYTTGAARSFVDMERLHGTVTETDTEWWSRNAPVLEQIVEPARYPVSSRVGQTTGEAYGSASSPALAFEFGLERVIDGIEAYVARHGEAPVVE